MTDEPRDDHPAAAQPPPDQPEGYTPEAPHAAELGELGSPGAGMTAEVPHPADVDLVEHGEQPADPQHAVNHESAAHVVEHAEPRLGPIDWGAWAYALIGVGAGAVIVLLFWLATR